MPDEPPIVPPATVPEAAPEPAPEPAKRGRKPTKPAPPPDLRPLAERVREAHARLIAGDGIIRAAQREIEKSERDVLDAQNRAMVARGAIRARERGLQQEAVRIIQKETGIRTIPGFSAQPKGLSAWLIAKKETQAKLQAAQQAAELQIEPPPAP